MSQLTVTSCDVCGAIKKEGNKWIKATVHLDGTASPGIWIGASGGKDVCGDACLQKLLGQVLTAVRASETPTPNQLSSEGETKC